MRKLHLISGFPRSGSTLLCQILNMNPDFHATQTSPVLDMLAAMQSVYSHNPGYKAVDRIAHYNRFGDAQRNYLEGWYSMDQVIFDKNRGWLFHLMKLDEILDNEDTKILWTYRDPLHVIASMEKHHRNYPLIEHSEDSQPGKPMSSLDGRMSTWVNENGIVMTPARALIDAVNMGHENRIHIIDYKRLCSDTQKVMEEIHKFLGEPVFEYDKNGFKDLKQVTHEYDHVYNYKYPHDIVEGKIVYSDPDVAHLEPYREIIAKRFEFVTKHCQTKLSIENNKRLSRKKRKS